MPLGLLAFMSLVPESSLGHGTHHACLVRKSASSLVQEVRLHVCVEIVGPAGNTVLLSTMHQRSWQVCSACTMHNAAMRWSTHLKQLADPVSRGLTSRATALHAYHA